MQAKELKFRVVGGMAQAKDRTRTTFFHSKPNQSLSLEVIPRGEEQIYQSSSKLSVPAEEQRFKAILTNEDPRKSKFIYAKLVMMEKLSCVIVGVIFLLSCAKTEADIAWGTPNQDPSHYLMNTLFVCTIGLILVLIIRQMGMYQLQTCQNKVYRPKHCSQCQFVTFLKHSGRVGCLLFEILVVLPHPIALLTGKTFQLFQTYDEIYLNHSWNDVLSLLLSAKVFIVFRTLLTLTEYSSPRASRLSHQKGFQHNRLYIIKCLVHQRPLLSIALTFGILIAVSSYCLKLAEGVLFLYNSGLKTGFESYENCLWSTFITMSTVGYGDYYPKTILGRTVMIIAAIFGVFLSSLLIVSLSLYLEMIPSENKSHLILARLGEQQNLLREASLAVTETMKIKKLMGSVEGQRNEKMKKEFVRLKEKIDNVKIRTREIKSLVSNDNLVEEMSRLFYILKDNLKDIYQGQLQLKREIEKIKEVNRIKLSFIKEMSEMLSKPSCPSFTTYPGRPGGTTVGFKKGDFQIESSRSQN